MPAFSAIECASVGPNLPLDRVAPAVRDAILLVEDDEMVALLLTQVLERINWRVLAAGAGAEGERLVAAHGSAIALALIDCGLPDMETAGFCERLRATLPGLPVLLTSGREYSGLAQSLAVDGPTAFLAKPFMPGDVMRQVKSLLAQTV